VPTNKYSSWLSPDLQEKTFNLFAGI
jgi:hypothetical protein